jgi:hypothetical protein
MDTKCKAHAQGVKEAKSGKSGTKAHEKGESKGFKLFEKKGAKSVKKAK